MDICVPLQKALVVGDLETTKDILDRDLLGYSISQDKETPLHFAIAFENIKLVEYLVDRMTEHQLALQDKYGYTALCIVAGVGNVDMARAMVGKYRQLLTIRAYKHLPIYFAALYGKRNMVAYLYGEYISMGGDDWTSADIHDVFFRCIQADLFDCALKILGDNNQIGFPEQKYAREVLYVLALKTHAFKDLKSWKNTWVRPAVTESVAKKLLRRIWKNILERPSDEINDILKGPMVVNEHDKETYPFQILFVAAEVGNIDFLVELIREYPEIFFALSDDRQTIIHVAVSHRHESIYNLLYEMGSLHDLLGARKDKQGNNMLHLVGMLAKSPSPLEKVSGAAFQMQRELLWFEEVNSKVPPYCREEKNHDGYTPLQLFMENHKKMVIEGEKWMKDTASQCMVVAALITTVVISVAFTIPGGYDQESGLPIFRKDGPFIAFVILDAISLILSSSSILVFLSILTSRYAQKDFLDSLPKRLMMGLTTLFLSIITMMVAFSISFFVLYRNGLISLPIIISVGSIVPICLYMKLQIPLLVDVYRSTCQNTYLFRPNKRVIHYRNPSF